MKIKIVLSPDEGAQWNTPDGRKQLLERVRSLGSGPDVEAIELALDAIHVVQLAPQNTRRLHAKLLELDCKRLAGLIGPNNKDEVDRAELADEILRLDGYFSTQLSAEPHKQ